MQILDFLIKYFCTLDDAAVCICHEVLNFIQICGLTILWCCWKATTNTAAATSANMVAAIPTMSVVTDNSLRFLFLDSKSAGNYIPPLKQTNMSQNFQFHSDMPWP